MKTLLVFSFALFTATSIMAQSRFPDDFVLIKGGTFNMGSPASEPERGTDETQHRVTVGDFYIAKSPVPSGNTVSLWAVTPANSRATICLLKM